MQLNPKHNLIIDGSNLIMTSLAVNKDDFIPDSGQYVGGVTGFLRSLSKLQDRLEPDAIYVTFDYDKSKYRLNLLPSYKGARVVADGDLKFRFSHRDEHQDILLDILPLLNIQTLVCPDTEADDIIASFVKQSKHYNTIVSTDKDFYQLINQTTSVYRPVSDEFIDHNYIEEYLGYPVDWHAVVKVVQGDVSDNIKGVKWLGAKTVVKIFKAVGIEKEAIKQHAIKLRDTRKKLPKRDWILTDDTGIGLIDFIDNGGWDLNLQLMDLNLAPEVDVRSLLTTVRYDKSAVIAYLTRLGFNGILRYNDYDYLFDPLKELT